MKTAEEYFFDEDRQELHIATCLKFITSNDPNFSRWFNRDNELTAIDIGCDDATPLLVIYEQFSFSKLVGIDKELELNVIKSLLNRLENIVENNVDHECLFNEIKNASNILEVLYARLTCNKKESISLTDFKKPFKFHFQTKAELYFKFNTDTYDFIILSNILHLICRTHELKPSLLDSIQFFDELVNRLKDKGVIYVRIEEREQFDPKKFLEGIYQKYQDIFHILPSPLFDSVNDNGDVRKTLKMFLFKK